jgi:hypothetical protein
MYENSHVIRIVRGIILFRVRGIMGGVVEEICGHIRKFLNGDVYLGSWVIRK